jgi:hypothetical protein
MNSHLSAEQISKWMMGERTWPEERHVIGCPQCSAAVARFQSTLAAFGGAVRDWSGRQTGIKPWRDGRRAQSLRWALATTAILLLAAVPIYREIQQRKVERARADAALLLEVDTEVSRAIAAPMEPLAKLMTWEENR